MLQYYYHLFCYIHKSVLVIYVIVCRSNNEKFPHSRFMSFRLHTAFSQTVVGLVNRGKMWERN